DVCIKAKKDDNTDKSLCERLTCIDNYLKSQTTAVVPGGTGQTAINKFWEADGELKELWTQLSTAMMQENGNADGDCGQVNDNGTSRPATPSEKAACKYLHAGFTELYKAPDAAPPAPSGAGILSKNNPSFRQTMGCFLLHAYAQHMKKKAVCDIEQGIKQAFDLWKEPQNKDGTSCHKDGANGKEPCVPCHWKETDYNSCTVNINGTEPTNVKKKLDVIIPEGDPHIKTMAEQVNKVDSLCDQVQCVTTRWMKDRTNNGGEERKWTDVWTEVKGQITALGGAISTATSKEKKDQYETYCSGIDESKGKDACILIAAGLKSLYDIKDNDNGNDAVTASFQRTMRCVLLNAIADKLESSEFPCTDEKKVADAIKKAFEKSVDIEDKSDGCKNGTAACFKCDRVSLKNLMNCQVGENRDKELKDKVEEMLQEDGAKDEIKKINDQAIKDICKPCTETTFCDRLKCSIAKWGKNRGGGVPTWHELQDHFKWRLGELATHMGVAAHQNEVAEHCKDNNGTPWEAGPAGDANKTACTLVAAGLHRISSIQHKYKKDNVTPTENNNPFDHQEFQQLVSCLWLKRLVEEMEKRSIICDISKGIKKGSEAWIQIKGKCTREPCIDCNLDELHQYEDCQIVKDVPNVKPKLEPLLAGEKKANVDKTLDAITKTKGNADSSLCPRLQCLASKVEALKAQGQNANAKEFWTDKGEVADLWSTLSTEMTKNGKDGDEVKCRTMDDNGTGTGRTATDPEKKGCNYLHAGLKKLYTMTATSTTSASTTPSSGTGSPVLDNPLLKQTVGCLLLHAYAKHMKGTSACVIDSGIKKAFKAFNDNNTTCKDNGTKPCVPCEWKEDEYDQCQITTTGSNGSNTENAKDKLKQVQENINSASKNNLTKINEMSTLCDYIRCVGPKWFKNNATLNGNSVTATKDWCDFWEKEGIKAKLEDMFNKIATDAQNESGTIRIAATCRNFGDENPQSVERKACNHIAAGLKYIKDLKGDKNGSTQPNAEDDDKFFKQSMMCAALNLYATKIRESADKSCPIDEKRIDKMFKDWNNINNSSCNAVRSASNADCFLCSRQSSDFEKCKLSVSNTLISSTQNGACNANATEVKKKMEGFLNEDPSQSPSKSIPKVKETLSTINDMSKSFCTQLQCAAKQYHSSKNNSVQPKPPLSWSEIKNVVEEELKKLLEEMSKKNDDSALKQYCDNVGSKSKDTPGEKKAKQKACKLFASGLKHISQIRDDQTKNDGPLKRTMMCAALNLYADQLISKSTDQCPLDNKKLEEAIKFAFDHNSNATKNGANSCPAGSTNSCFECKRQDSSTFGSCQIGKDKKDKVKPQLESLLEKNDQSNPNNNQEKTLEKINKIESFCTQVQCAIKQHYRTKKGQTIANGTEPSWGDIEGDAKDALKQLLEQMTKGQTESDIAEYCKNDEEWNKLGHKEKHTNKAACLFFAAGLKHIYDQKKGHVNGPSFEQTMGCLFLKEYAKQLKVMAEEQKKYKVHPNCSVDSGIEYAFSKSKNIMEKAKPPCEKNVPNSCFECTQNDDYGTCFIGAEKVQGKVEPLFKDNDQNKKHMEETLENTLCPILLTDLLTPFLPLAPVSIGLSAMAYYLWKYFGPLGKGGARFRRSPADIPGPSVQEQVLDHVEEAGPHEYRLVKERKPRSAPTRTKRSGPVNRRTIIEIHFEVLDECQKGDTQLNQKDFLELLVQEFMGSELMEEEQVPKEELFMEGVPMESIPLERVPSLGSVFMV
ncbi:SICAvar type I, partial [Plasmodium knowlesi]